MDKDRRALELTTRISEVPFGGFTECMNVLRKILYLVAFPVIHR